MLRIRHAVVLIAPTVALAASALSPPPATEGIVAPQQPQRAPFETWVLREEAGALKANYMAPVSSASPPYTVVSLRRSLGASTVDCGNFGAPVVIDIATARIWSYRMPKPKNGACTPGGGAKFTAVGRQNGIETATAAVP